jgi:hypothetical protein
MRLETERAGDRKEPEDLAGVEASFTGDPCGDLAEIHQMQGNRPLLAIG